MRKLKFIVLAVACSAVVSTYISINTNKSTVGDITLTELINTPDANAICEQYAVNNGRCGISDRCFWTGDSGTCDPWAPNT